MASGLAALILLAFTLLRKWQFVVMLQSVDPCAIAGNRRCRHVWQVRERLHYPDAKARLKRIAIVEERIRPVSRRRSNRGRDIRDEALSTRRGGSASDAPTGGVALGDGGAKRPARYRLELHTYRFGLLTWSL